MPLFLYRALETDDDGEPRVLTAYRGPAGDVLGHGGMVLGVQSGLAARGPPVRGVEEDADGVALAGGQLVGEAGGDGPTPVGAEDGHRTQPLGQLPKVGDRVRLPA